MSYIRVNFFLFWFQAVYVRNIEADGIEIITKQFAESNVILL